MPAMFLINDIGLSLNAPAIVSLLTWAFISNRKHELEGAQLVVVGAERPTARPRRAPVRGRVLGDFSDIARVSSQTAATDL